MGTSEMCKPDGELTGATISANNPAILPSSQNTLPL